MDALVTAHIASGHALRRIIHAEVAIRFDRIEDLDEAVSVPYHPLVAGTTPA